MSGLVLEGVRKSYGEVDVIHGVDLTIDHGEFCVFVGPSGCGKSTLLRTIAGLEEISGGTIAIGGDDVTNVEPSDRGVAMVFQSYALYPHMSVEENMGFGLKMTGTDKAEVKRRVDKAAAILHLDKLLDRKPKALSGGQRQRVAIGRAIVREPKVFLFDEPLSNLDAELRVQMRLEIAKLHQDLGATMIYVTHDQVEAMTLADKIVVLRAGNIEQVGSPLDLYDQPANMFVAGFIGSPKMNFLPAVVKEVSGDQAVVSLPQFGDVQAAFTTSEQLAPGRELVVGIRPEHFDTAAPVQLSAEVEVVEHLGGVTYAYAKLGSERDFTIDLKDDRVTKAGDVIRTGFDPKRAFLFDPKSEKRVSV